MPWYSHWLTKLIGSERLTPRNRHDFIQLLRQANANNLFDEEALGMLEGVLQVSELRVGDFMVPRAKIIAIEKQQRLEDFLPLIIESQHSRFPIYDQELDAIDGILLAKDLLTYLLDKQQAFELIFPFFRECVDPLTFGLGEVSIPPSGILICLHVTFGLGPLRTYQLI